MMPETFVLPDILKPSDPLVEDNVFFYLHVGNDSHVRTKISFSTHCITLLLSGKKKVIHAGDSIFYDNRNCLLFKSGNYLSTEISPGKDPYHSLLIFFDGSTINQFKYKYWNKLQTERTNEKHANYLSKKTDFFLEGFKEIVVSLISMGSLTQAMQRLKFEELLLYLVEREGGSILDFFDLDLKQDRYHFFKSIIQAHARNNLNIEEIAFLCHMSISTFKRTFFEIYGVNPGKWFRVKRLEHAAYLMRVMKKRPIEVYDEVGFSSLSSFSYSFKQKFGITPKQFQLLEDRSLSMY